MTDKKQRGGEKLTFWEVLMVVVFFTVLAGLLLFEALK